jgi:hypothetical protein
MHFSRCGQYLYYLLVTFAEVGELGSTCEVLVSEFPFKPEAVEQELLQPRHEPLRLTYRFAAKTDRLRSPYVISFWEQDELFLCLPALSCKPKILRLKLLDVKNPGSPGSSSAIETLTKPVFFPNSTPARNPQIIYRSSQSDKKDMLVLTLDSPPGLGLAISDANSYKFPQVMEWKIDNKTGWRAWDETVDGEDTQLTEDKKTYASLRGNFVDADQPFNVVVRNGLNWKKKAFLSCA